MPVLVLEQYCLEENLGVHPISVEQNSPIVEAIKLVGVNEFEFEYACVEPYAKAKITKKAFEKIYDPGHVFGLIEEYDIIILMGKRLSEEVLQKPMKSIYGKAQKIGDKILIPIDSSLDLFTSKRSCDNTFLLAYRYLMGEIVDKPYTSFEVVESLERLREVVEMRHITKICAFDYETTGEGAQGGFEYFNPSSYATVLSLTYTPGYSYIIPMEHPDFSWGEDFKEVLALVSEIYMDPTVEKVGHNIKFDMNWSNKYGLNFRGRLTDTMLMFHLIDENARVGLKKLCAKYFPFWKDYDVGVDYNGPLSGLTQYAALDTDITLRLRYIGENILLEDGNSKLYLYFRNLSMFALPVFQKIEYRGAKVDRNRIITSLEKAEKLLKKKEAELNSYREVKHYRSITNKEKIDEKIADLKEKIERYISKGKGEHSYVARWKEEVRSLKTGGVELFSEVNFGSWQQLQDILYDYFNFPVPLIQGVPTKTTNRDYISAFDSPFITTLFAYRTISKMISTYYKGLLDKLDPQDMVHSTFKLNGTVTGRLSSAAPNLQNIPARLNFKDEDAEWCLKEVKKFYITKSDDYYLIQADYSQAELRVIANVSGDEVMRQAYLDGEDLHAKTGAQIMGLTLEEFMELPPEQYKKGRTNAKPANFGWVYKASIEGYMEFAKNQYGIELDEVEAARHRDAIFGTYPEIQSWHMKSETRVQKFGYMETMLGRRRRLPDIYSTKTQLYNQAVRNAVNSPIQGTAGELTLYCMGWLYHRLPEEECMMWSTVHDSVFFYLKKDRLDLLEIINETFENPPIYEYFDVNPDDWPIPMKMDYEISETNWREMEEIGDWDAVKSIL